MSAIELVGRSAGTVGEPLMPGFFVGGFECSSHRRAHDRRRLDLIAG